MNRKKKQFFSMNIGSASMMLIFVILCLVSFAALSIVSANADRRLSRKITERTTLYYEACNQAQESLANLNKVLMTQYTTSSDSEDYFVTVGHSKAFTVPISDSQMLLVEVEILYPDSDEAPYYRITEWKVILE